MEYAVKGLVLRCTDLGESDRLITLFTKEMGAVTAMAKGARSLKNRNFAASQQFCYSDFILVKRKDKLYVSESSVIESFFSLRDSLAGFSLALYISEALSFVTTAEPEGELLRLSLNALYAICEGKRPLPIIKAGFEIRMLSIIGFMPDTTGCSTCGGTSPDYFFDFINGVFVCRECRQSAPEGGADDMDTRGATPVCIVTEGVRLAMSYIIGAPLSRVFSFTLSDDELSILEYACEEYVKNQLERSFNSLEFYKEVK